MATVRTERLGKAFGRTVAVDDVTLAVEEGRVLALLGPSGCGKTTLLRLIAGLETPTRGRVLLDDQDVTDLPPERRGIGMMFQSYALFPHMTVAENLRFPLRMRGDGDRRAQAARVREALALVRLEGLGERLPRQLSGGQQQRVALARALVARPRVLLLDEPLSNLDARLREEMQVELLELWRRVNVTTVLVTHDQAEALSLADRIAVMRQGAVEQAGAPEEIYARPRTPFVADFIGAANLVEAEVRREGDGWVARTADGLAFPVPPPEDGREGARRVALRQEDLALTDRPAGVEVAVPTAVVARVYRGAHVHHVARLGGQLVRVMTPKERSAAADRATHLGWRRDAARVL
jgi:ABC-type Fe3+/spermidine/putrescine transport system ATPase subunit